MARVSHFGIVRGPIGAAAVSLCLALTMVGCGGSGSKSWAGERGGGKEGGRGGESSALKVEGTHMRPARIERSYRASGTLQALRSAEIIAVQPGIIRGITVEEGDTVKEGQTLAKLDGRELKLAAQRAGLEAENLSRELERLESISATNAVAREEIDKQRYAVQEAQAAAKLSRHQARQTTVKAPFTGTITQRHVDMGNLATTATPLFSLADVSALELELHLPEREASTVKLGSTVDIELLDGSKFPSEVIRRAPVVDPLTGTVKFTVRAKTYPEAAVPGAFARASVLVDVRENASSLPRSAVFDVEGTPHVYAIREGKARRTAVELGLEGEDRVEIMAGVSADDTIVVDSSAGITEGMPLDTIVSNDAGAQAGP